MSASRTSAEVLVVGADPTGLVLALWLARLGVRVRVIDKNAEADRTSRALAVQARTLEFYRQLGIAESLVGRGCKAVAVNFRGAGVKEARAEFGDAGRDISPFPYALIFPQDEHERLLTGCLAESGIGVERGTELLGFTDSNGRLAARLRLRSGAEESCEVSFMAGCDGAHSTVREKLGIGFPGGLYAHLFYVADVEAAGPAIDGEIHIELDKADFLAVFPLKEKGRARLVGTIRGMQSQSQRAGWNDVSGRAIERMRIDVRRVNWFSTYRVHHRVADHFRKGGAFLLGDAAHIHSPVGGQGMNTGIGDAVNLAWKLAAVLRNRANAALLDSYEPERIAFARRLVATTDRAFTAITSGAPITRYLRLNVMTAVIPRLFSFAAVRRLMFRTVSQTGVNYRGSSLSQGRAGRVRGGDRLPWVNGNMSAGENNFLPLASLDWQVHIYGEAPAGFRAMCTAQKLPVHVFPWRMEMGRAGLERDVIYLIRPDGYVALANSGHNMSAVADYLRAREITMTAKSSRVDNAFSFHRGV